MSEEIELYLPLGFALEMLMPSSKIKSFDEVDIMTIKFDIPDEYNDKTKKDNMEVLS